MIGRRDLRLLRDTALDKLAGLRCTAPLYAPTPGRAVGRSLRVSTGAEIGSLRRVEVLPKRTIALADGETIAAPPLHAFELEAGRLVTDTRALTAYITVDDVVVAEASADFRGPVGTFPSLRRLQRFPPRRRVGPVASLLTGGGGSQTYFHWLYDVLPRIHLLEQAGRIRSGDRYVVPRLDQRFKAETLELAGLDAADCTEINRPTLIEADRITVTAGHRDFRRVEPWVPRFLRARFRRESAEAGLRLYVNRRDTTFRKVINESELETALSARGFESVSMAGLSFQEKVDAYSAADVVVAPHGAGLSNIAFCPSGTHVVDIAGSRASWYWPTFLDVSSAVGLRYRRVNGLRMLGSPLVAPKLRAVMVDVPRVLEAVDEVLGRHPGDPPTPAEEGGERADEA